MSLSARSFASSPHLDSTSRFAPPVGSDALRSPPASALHQQVLSTTYIDAPFPLKEEKAEALTEARGSWNGKDSSFLFPQSMMEATKSRGAASEIVIKSVEIRKRVLQAQGTLVDVSLRQVEEHVQRHPHRWQLSTGSGGKETPWQGRALNSFFPIFFPRSRSPLWFVVPSSFLIAILRSPSLSSSTPLLPCTSTRAPIAARARNGGARCRPTCRA